MPRIDLRVPLDEKEDAKRLGARWDPRQKLWYVPDGVDAAPLARWLPVPEAPNIRAASYFVARTVRECWRCEAATGVVGLVLPPGHEVLWVADDPAEDCWELAEEPTVLSDVTDLAADVATHLRRAAPHYRVDFSQTTGTFYWMNHCEHCGAKLGDEYTFNTFGEGFNPATPEAARAIRLAATFKPFSAWCGSYTVGLDWFVEPRALR
jgi:hypothetical protein